MLNKRSRLEALAASRGWRLTWSAKPWTLMKSRIVSVQIHDVRGHRLIGGSSTAWGVSDERATDDLAGMILDAYQGSGAAQQQ